VVGAWLALAAALAPLQPRLQERAADESDTFLVRGSESAAAKRTIDDRFRRGSEMAALIVYFRDGGLTGDDLRRIDADALAVCRSGAIPSLALVGTPRMQACGRSDPLDLSPGAALLRSSDGSVALASALTTRSAGSRRRRRATAQGCAHL
jgi:RND superfamily putative drug exporter